MAGYFLSWTKQSTISSLLAASSCSYLLINLILNYSKFTSFVRQSRRDFGNFGLFNIHQYLELNQLLSRLRHWRLGLQAAASAQRLVLGKQRMLMVTLAWSDVFDDVNNLLISPARQTVLSTEEI